MLEFEDSEAAMNLAERAFFSANATQNAVDIAVQYCGGNGIGKDLLLATFYESVRTFRIIDGADEIHLRTIARAVFENVDERELESVSGSGRSRAPQSPNAVESSVPRSARVGWPTVFRTCLASTS